MSRVIASIEARMGSSRLPGKVLVDICGKPSLTQLLNRLRRCKTLDGIILATSTLKDDDPLEAWANSEAIPIHRGSEKDVLSRVVDAQKLMKSDVMVGITGDCPLIDPDIIDMSIRTFLANDCDVVSLKGSYPIGIGVAIYKLRILEENSLNIFDPLVREHSGYYVLRHPELYKTITLVAPNRWNLPHYRFSLDFPEDLEFIRTIYTRLEPRFGDNFNLDDILNLISVEPSLLDINSMHQLDDSELYFVSRVKDATQ